MNRYIAFTVTLLAAMEITLVSSNTLLGWGPENVKQGICPESDPDKYYSDDFKNECLRDDDCLKNKKCCFQESSGHLCMDPVIITKAATKQSCGAKTVSTKPGYCPRPDPNMYCIWCNDSCVSDCDCDGKLQKCCYQPGCGNTCKDATDVASGWTGAICN